MLDGNKFRVIRKKHGLSLQQLSDKSGVSVSMISQIERNNVDPTMTTLYKLCQGLDITIASLFTSSDVEDRVVKKDERKTIVLPNSKLKYQLLTPNTKGDLEMLLIELEPGQEDRQMINHHGEECGFVLKGKLTVILDEKEYLLHEGDSIYFNSDIPHRFINQHDEKSVSIWAMTPASF
ncbi:cupin domain-containing protein [Pseudogracilibacillus sp. SO30301A]|uniref:cupin domain-containing protein n=1 Tax=Pseudogracilibacillus sp. SO30301A TaxID=3098291 RepID=UPI00300E0C83